ncbi:GP179 protein, partial [Anseranas semipalmata]|nr:GP179 protein [Anseranas semipalmata]
EPAAEQGKDAPGHHAEEPPPGVKPGAGSPRPPGAAAQSTAAAGPRAEVCPWEALGAPPGALSRQEAMAAGGSLPRGGSPMKVLGKGSSQPGPRGAREGWGTEGLPARSRSTEVAQAGRGVKTEICPWEQSRDGDSPCRAGPGSVRPGGGLGAAPAKPPQLPAAAPEPLGSTGGSTAEVCPWESREGAVAARAEICPWEAAEPHPEKEGAASPRSSQRVSVCPWEGAEEPGTGLAAKSPALPKTSSKRAGNIDSKKADICPWEAEDEPLAKTEICPWEVPAAPPGKERLSQDMRGTPRAGDKPRSRGLEDNKAKLAEEGGGRPE